MDTDDLWPARPARQRPSPAGRLRRAALATAGAGGLATVLAASAWACTPQARIVGVNPLSAPPGSTVTVKAENMAPGKVVELRWNAITGETVAAAEADRWGAVALEATVPDAPPGVYSLVAVSPGQGFSRTVFEVTATPAPSGATPPAVADSTPTRRGSASPGGPAPGLVPAAVLLAGAVLAGVGVVAAGPRRARAAAAAARPPA